MRTARSRSVAHNWLHERRWLQKKLGCARASLGSLSEATSVFNPDLLKEIIAELGEQLQPIAADSRLKDIRETITLVDGTLLSALPQMMEASLLKQTTGSGMIKWRLHTHFELAKNWPVRMDLSPNGGGEHDERAMLGRVLEPDRLYVMDRGYQKFTLFNQIVESNSSYVCRLRDNSVWEALESSPPTTMRPTLVRSSATKWSRFPTALLRLAPITRFE